MAGHSKYKNIMYRKGAQDKKRSAMFSKLSREITVAAKMGLPDPEMNARLRSAVLAAKAQSMPKDNIQRSIDKASGVDAENYEEIRYEGFGPGGVALIVEALSDNRNRTATNVRTAFSKNGGNLGASGSRQPRLRADGPDRISGDRRRCRQGARSRDRGRCRRRRIGRGRPRHLDQRRNAARSRQGARSRCSAKARAPSSPGSPATEVEVRGEDAGDADEADRRARGGRRRPDRLGQLRRPRRGAGEAC